MSVIDFLILALATWRLSSLFVDERGPFDLFVKIRSLTGITHDENGVGMEYPERFLPQLLSCVWCTSVWVGIGISVGYYLFGHPFTLVLLPLALSAAAILSQKYLKG